MGGKPRLKTVLIVDDDLGFVFWLGHVLDTVAYSALPAKSVADAALLILQLDLSVDLLLINPTLSGSPEFIAAIHREHRGVRVIGIVNNAMQLNNIHGVDAYQAKPDRFDQEARDAWLHCVERVLANRSLQNARE